MHVAPELHRTLQRLHQQPADRVDLAELMLRLSLYAHPELDMAAQLARIDAIAEGLRGRLIGQRDPLQRALTLSQYMVESCGFRGDRETYYDPANSCLHLVLERRVGIPISLSALYIAVGQRAGVALEGVGFPLHFLVRPQGVPDAFIDPFDGGRLLTRRDCAALLDAMSGAQIPFDPRFLEPLPPTELIRRVLRNLKHAHLRRDQLHEAIACIDLLLALSPSHVDELRDRGLLHMSCNAWRLALDDLQAYLHLAPEAPDRLRVEASMWFTRQQLLTVN